jgi:hypothetical protein
MRYDAAMRLLGSVLVLLLASVLALGCGGDSDDEGQDGNSDGGDGSDSSAGDSGSGGSEADDGGSAGSGSGGGDGSTGDAGSTGGGGETTSQDQGGPGLYSYCEDGMDCIGADYPATTCITASLGGEEVGGFCSHACDAVAEGCAPPDWVDGDAVPGCTAGGYCYLGCPDDKVCPTGMECIDGIPAMCVWPW